MLLLYPPQKGGAVYLKSSATQDSAGIRWSDWLFKYNLPNSSIFALEWFFLADFQRLPLVKIAK